MSTAKPVLMSAPQAPSPWNKFFSSPFLMYTFLIGIAILVVGYFTWGKIAEKIFSPDNRLTPAIAERDNTDKMPLPNKRNMLIQLLNIAGIGPIVGVALGILFGPIVFIIMPIGNVLGGAIHDYFSGMISLRNNGKDLPLLISKFLGKKVNWIFSLFLIAAILLVVATFVNIPANFIAEMIPLGSSVFVVAVICIFLYYIISSIAPIDKIIGRIYPFMGVLILIVTGVVAVVLMATHAGDIPDIPLTVDGFLGAWNAHPTGQPLIPMLFVTIACGILSGFHATQSPIVARTLTSEHAGRRVFYGMMIVEGLIGMVWAAAASVFYVANTEVLTANLSGTTVIYETLEYLLPVPLIFLSVVAFIFLSVTSGDTALRVLRTSTATQLNIPQNKPIKRVLLLLPVIGVVTLLLFWPNLSGNGFAILWNYFSWFNQVIACFALLTITVYLASKKKIWIISAVPAACIIFVCVSYITWISPEHLAGAPVGFGLPLEVSYIIAAVFAIGLTVLAVLRGRALSRWKSFSADTQPVYPPAEKNSE